LEPTAVLVGTTVTLVMEGTPSETMLPSVLRAPRVTVVEGPTPSAKQSTPLQEAEVVVITAPPGRVVGTLEAVMAGVTPAPISMMLPSEFKAPRVTVAEMPVMLGTPVTVGVAPAPRPRSRMLPSAGLRTPRVAVAEGPRPIAKQTSPLHLVEVAVKTPLGAEKVVGVAPALPPTPRLTVALFPIPRVAHKLTNAPPQLVVVEVTVTPEGKVTPVGIEIALVIDPTPLVTPEMMGTEENPGMEVLPVVPTLMIEDAPFVASLRIEEMALVGFTAEVIPVISDASEEATPEGKTLVGNAVISLAIELSTLDPREVALVRPPRMEET
jgi:hypothetical protein